MPRGYRHIVLAAVGGLIAGASPPQPHTSPEQHQAEQSIAHSLRDIAASLQKAKEPGHKAKPCDPEKPDRGSDLCAQWQAADAAVESTLWAERAFYLGIGGVFVGLLTLAAAAAAALYARKAAIETEKGATAARDAVTLTKEHGFAELRAYLAVTAAAQFVEWEEKIYDPKAGVGYWDEDTVTHTIAPTIELNETGVTAASDIVIYIRSVVVRNGVPAQMNRSRFRGRYAIRSDLPKGTVVGGTESTKGRIARGNNEEVCYVFLLGSYRVFDGTRISNFCAFRMTPGIQVIHSPGWHESYTKTLRYKERRQNA